MRIRVLVTGIGGDLGQAVARALRQTELFEAEIVAADCETINTWTVGPFSNGWFHRVPKLDDPLWLPTLRHIAEERECDVVILASGTELQRPFALPRNFVRFGPAWVHRVFADKHWMAQALQKRGIPVAATLAVEKPRSLSGGRYLELVRQTYLDGPEYTVAVWNRRAFALRRELRGGATVRAWSAPLSDEAMACCDLGRQIAESFGTKGSFNVQCRVVDAIPTVFEINPRFSSTASMRASFGFEDVAWSVLETLGQAVPPEPRYEAGRAVRFWEETVQIGGEWRYS